MMRTTCALAAMVMIALAAAPADGAQVYQRVPFGSTPNPVGSGGRAVAWGGAFIAVADDATSASWNPAGLVQLLTPEVSVVGSYHTRYEDAGFKGFDADSESVFSDSFNLNYASAAVPFHLGDVNMVASINYQRLYEFDRNMEFDVAGEYLDASSNLNIFSETRSLEQVGALTTVTPAFAIQITPAWSMGLSVNIWGLDSEGDGWEQQWEVYGVTRNTAVPGSTVENWSLNEEEYTLSGYNFVIGTHYKIQNFTIGAVYKTSWEADVEFKSTQHVTQYSPVNPALTIPPVHFNFEEDQKLVWPESYGVGVAYRYSDRLSFALDAYATAWSNYKIKSDLGDLNLIAGNDETADIEDTWQIRMGTEYLWVLPKYVFALRSGVFYDPEQMGEEVNDYYGLALGGGMVYQDIVVDAALQYKWANQVQSEKISGVYAESDVSDFFGIVSLIYHF